MACGYFDQNYARHETVGLDRINISDGFQIFGNFNQQGRGGGGGGTREPGLENQAKGGGGGGGVDSDSLTLLTIQYKE